ncbi:Hypothetical protein P9303_18611 [Prochlorococcus marinus str. MIT 9303]|uniref:Uncharacterized protein n=1 Tax=Prochlorococcus marinus (strain MIT 9303) TaxID=59922 RepID=A2CAU3_PROM3|nr:Hypothetical protein P9303_18611 [Prochlorococcus marinus str. MIT 9303]
MDDKLNGKLGLAIGEANCFSLAALALSLEQFLSALRRIRTSSWSLMQALLNHQRK